MSYKRSGAVVVLLALVSRRAFDGAGRWLLFSFLSSSGGEAEFIWLALCCGRAAGAVSVNLWGPPGLRCRGTSLRLGHYCLARSGFMDPRTGQATFGISVYSRARSRFYAGNRPVCDCPRSGFLMMLAHVEKGFSDFQ